VEGYWDYPLRERGLLFAPVAIDFSLALRPHWFYHPGYVVNEDCLLGALFVNADCDHYYFGDYFDAGYRRRGFIGWLDFCFGHGGYDPLYGYYRACYGADSDWEHGLRDLYAGRFSGELARPPRTLIQQNTVVQNITNNTITNNTIVNNTNINNIANVTNVRNVTMLTSLSQVDPAVTRLQPVSEQVQNAALRTAQDRLAFAGQRANLESKLLSQGHIDASRRPTTVNTTPTPQVVKVNLPKSQGNNAATASKAPAPLSGQTARKAQLPSVTSGARPQAMAAKPAPAPGRQYSVTQPATTAPTVKSKAPPIKSVDQHPTIQASSTQSVAKPQAAPANKQVRQQRVTHGPQPTPKVPAAPSPKASPKAQVTTTKPSIAHRSAQPPATKPAAKPPAAPMPKATSKTSTAPAKPAVSRPVAQPPATKPAAKPQAASPPKAAAKPQPAPALKQAAKPPAAPTPRPRPAPTAQVASKPQAPAKPAPKPETKPQAGKSKDRPH
jgi:hypothetical protein